MLCGAALSWYVGAFSSTRTSAAPGQWRRRRTVINRIPNVVPTPLNIASSFLRNTEPLSFRSKQWTNSRQSQNCLSVVTQSSTWRYDWRVLCHTDFHISRPAKVLLATSSSFCRSTADELHIRWTGYSTRSFPDFRSATADSERVWLSWWNRRRRLTAAVSPAALVSMATSTC